MNFRNQLVRVSRASLGQLPTCRHGSGAAIGRGPMDHHDARKSKRETVCADLVALSREPVFHASPSPLVPVR